MVNNREIYQLIKKAVKSYAIYLLLAIVFINIILIIPNGFVVQNNDWIGFYGGLLGSLIGGLVTFLGVKLTIDNARQDKINEEIKSIRPFLQLEIEKSHKIDLNDTKDVELFSSEKMTVVFPDNITKQNFFENISYTDAAVIIYFINSGRDSACNLNSIVISEENNCDLFEYQKTLIKGEKSELFVVLHRWISDQSFYLDTFYEDLNGNNYRQRHNITLKDNEKFRKYIILSNAPELY